MQTVVEEYVSCVTQKIFGTIYTAGEVVPGAETLQTLPALLRTNRIRTRSTVVVTEDNAQDIGSAQATPKTPAEKRAATIAAKKAKAEAL